MLQGTVSGPGQFSLGYVIIGRRVFVPPPQVALHSPYSPHSYLQGGSENKKLYSEKPNVLTLKGGPTHLFVFACNAHVGDRFGSSEFWTVSTSLNL